MVKPGYFPEPYPDELLYSMFVRFHCHTFSISQKHTSEALFGNKYIGFSFDVQSHINEFVDQVSDFFSFTSDEIYNKFTLLPFYFQFTPRDKHLQILELLKGKKSIKAANHLGIIASSYRKKNTLKYCPACVKEDKQEYDETYWHRSHQIPCIMLCIKHNCFLQEDVRFLKLKTVRLISPEDLLSHDLEIRLNTNPRLFEVANLLEQILFQPANFNFEDLNYYELARNAGYQIGRRINISKLYQDLTEFYSQYLLDLLFKESLHPFHSKTFFNILYKTYFVRHGIRHVLLYYFLNEKIKEKKHSNPSFKSSEKKASKKIFEAIKNKPSDNPEEIFGKGPWKCINKASDHYDQFVITHASFDYKYEKYIGRFSCSCGMIYSKSFKKDLASQKVHENILILDYGHEWHNKLSELINQNSIIKEICEQLKANPLTVFDQADQLGITKLAKKEKLAHYKKEYLKLINQHPTTLIKDLEKLNTTAFNFLIKNDATWLKKIHKKIIARNHKVEKKSLVARDKRVLKCLKKKLQELKKTNPPFKLSISYLCQNSDPEALKAYNMSFKNFPLTKDFLDKNCESIEDYQIRRIKNVTARLKEEDIEITERKIINAAGLHHKELYPKVRFALNEILMSKRITKKL